jgi:RNase H-like domain found in reverse transcriptase
MLTSSLVLERYSLDCKSMLETNASDGVVARVLSQQIDDQLWDLVAYFLKTIALAKYNYEIHNKEMLAIIRALE